MDHWVVVSSRWDLPIALGGRVGRIAIMVGVMVTVFLLIVIQFVRARELYGRGDSDAPNQRTNCPSCGARTSASADTCDHCGEPLTR